MKRFALLSLVWVVLLLTGQDISRAEETDKDKGKEQPQEMEEIIVTATRYKKAIKDAPGSVIMVTDKEIAKFRLVGVDEALKFSPGVNAGRAKGRSSIWGGYSIRSFGDSRCLTLVDGQMIDQWADIPVELIERIEVIKGPFSALYGDKAMGGVVNIITKQPEKMICKTDHGFESYGTTLSNFLFGHKVGKINFLISAKETKSDGYVSNFYTVSEYTGATVPTVTVKGWEKTKDIYGNPKYLVGDCGKNWRNDEYRSLKLGYEFSPLSRLDFQIFSGNSDYGYELGGKSYLWDTATGAVVNTTGTYYIWDNGVQKKVSISSASFESSYGGEPFEGYTLAYDRTLSDQMKLKFNLGWDTHDHWYADANKNYSTTVYGKYWSGVQSVINLSEQHILTTGLDWRGGDVECEKWIVNNWLDIDSKNRLDLKMSGKVKNSGLYLQDEWKVLKNLTLFPGVRSSQWKASDGKCRYWNSATSSFISGSFGSENETSFDPRLAVVYQPREGTTVRSSFGTAFRGPEATDLYKDWYYYGKLYQGNPKLKPEENRAWEFGVTQEVRPGTTIEATYFDNRMDDYIARRTLTDAEITAYNTAHGTTYASGKISQYDNIAKAKSTGTEIGIKQKLPYNLSAFANHTLNRTKTLDNPTNPAAKGKELSGCPKNTLNLGLTYAKEFKDKNLLSGSLTGQYVDDAYSSETNLDHNHDTYGGYGHYLVVDFKLAYTLDNQFKASFTINNVFDKEYYQYYLAPGRIYGVDFSVKF